MQRLKDKLGNRVDSLLAQLSVPEHRELRARHLTQSIALAVQAALMLQNDAPGPARAFIASRLVEHPPAAFGTLVRPTDLEALIGRILTH